MRSRVGIGYDSHRLVEGRPLILGGVEIPFEQGLLGHSDGDALLHAITDARRADKRLFLEKVLVERDIEAEEIHQFEGAIDLGLLTVLALPVHGSPAPAVAVLLS